MRERKITFKKKGFILLQNEIFVWWSWHHIFMSVYTNDLSNYSNAKYSIEQYYALIGERHLASHINLAHIGITPLGKKMETLFQCQSWALTWIDTNRAMQKNILRKNVIKLCANISKQCLLSSTSSSFWSSCTRTLKKKVHLLVPFNRREEPLNTGVSAHMHAHISYKRTKNMTSAKDDTCVLRMHYSSRSSFLFLPFCTRSSHVCFPLGPSLELGLFLSNVKTLFPVLHANLSSQMPRL